jgi:hypothetical protein
VKQQLNQWRNHEVEAGDESVGGYKDENEVFVHPGDGQFVVFQVGLGFENDLAFEIPTVEEGEEESS